MRIVLGIYFFLLSAGVLAQAPSSEDVSRVLPKTLELYRWLHAHPELSLQEEQTSSRLAEELRDIGLDVTEGVGGYGVVGVLQGAPGGPVILYRADMDALPLQEDTGLPYSSQNRGVMHACGHDIHMSSAVGTLRVLASKKASWRGTVLFVGQPAEEVGSGAESIIADPKFQSIVERVGKPSLAIALHDDGSMKAGQAALTKGFVTANVDSVDITIIGKGGHGALPSECVDPIIIGSELVTAFQTIVSRKLPSGTRAVVTVGVFQAGTKRNIIPTKAVLKLTIRSYSEEVRTQIVEDIRRLSAAIAQAHGAPEAPRIVHYSQTYTPAGFNDSDMVERLTPVFESRLGKENILEIPPSMVGEDFSEYNRRLKIPSVMFLVGASAVDGPEQVLHSAQFVPDAEATLRTSVGLMAASLMAFLR